MKLFSSPKEPEELLCPRCGSHWDYWITKSYSCSCGYKKCIGIFRSERENYEKELGEKVTLSQYEHYLLEKYAFNHPDFDEELFKKQIKESKEIREKIQKVKAEHKEKQAARTAAETAAKPIVHCPFCNSTDTTKITASSRAVSYAVWGIFSDKRGKQWKCNSCKSLF